MSGHLQIELELHRRRASAPMRTLQTSSKTRSAGGGGVWEFRVSLDPIKTYIFKHLVV